MWYQWSLCLVLEACDFITTRILVDKEGYAVEANPFMRLLIQTHGIDSMLYLKLAIVMLLAASLLVVKKESYDLIGKVLCYSNILTGAVVGWGIFRVLYS